MKLSWVNILPAGKWSDHVSVLAITIFYYNNIANVSISLWGCELFWIRWQMSILSSFTVMTSTAFTHCKRFTGVAKFGKRKAEFQIFFLILEKKYSKKKSSVTSLCDFYELPLRCSRLFVKWQKMIIAVIMEAVDFTTWHSPCFPSASWT